MNVYLFELRNQAGSIAFQTVMLSALLAGLVLGAYPIYTSGEAQVRAALEGFPPEFAAAVGLSVENIFSYGGFYAFGSLYLLLMGAIFAASLGLAVFSREKRSQCMDFLLAKPLGRTNVFIAKLCACITGLVVMNTVYIATALAVHVASGDTTASSQQIVLVSLGMAGTQAVFLACAIGAATFLRRVRSVSGMASLLGFSGFVLAALVSLTEEEALRVISPLQYFDPSPVFSTGSYQVEYVVVALVVIVVLVAVSFVRFRTSDIAAR